MGPANPHHREAIFQPGVYWIERTLKLINGIRRISDLMPVIIVKVKII
jgi:hypothetical protein